MIQVRDIATVKHHGNYSVTGPVRLPLRLDNGAVELFSHEGFVFPGGRYSVLYPGERMSDQNLLVRVSSNCQWALYFGSLFCDCRWQLEEAKIRIARAGAGLLVFAHDQNGKGIPIEDHWKVYAEGQRRNLELVVDAYEQTGFREDYRDYRDVADILRHYDVKSIRLLTNNPNRLKFFEENGFDVALENLEQPIHPHLKAEYKSKKQKLGHLLKTPDAELR